jgi:hypothetical protein
LRTWISRIAFLGLVFLALPLVHWATRPLAASDVFWQVRTGEIALETGTFPAADPFSYTMHGAAWNNHEWGFELVVALLHAGWGWNALRLLVLAIVLSTAIGLVVVVGRRAGAAGALLAVAAFALFARYKMMPVPQLASMALFLAAFHAFRGGRLAASWKRTGLLALVMLAWGNLTAEALMFLPFFVADQALYRLSPRPNEPLPPPPRRHALQVAIVCVAPLATPPWSSTLEYVLFGLSTRGDVNTEFAPLWAPATAVTPWAKHVAAVLVAAYAIWAVHRFLSGRGRRRDAAREIVPGLLACALAVAFERNLWLLVLPLGRLLVALGGRAVSPARLAIAQGAAVVLAAAIFLRFAWVLGWTPGAALAIVASEEYRRAELDAGSLPVACVEALALTPSVTRVFTLRSWAGYVIWRLPHARVFIDGRNREYPPELHRAGARIWAGSEDALRLLDATGTEAVVARPGWNELPHVAKGGWELRARGPRCALFERSDRAR